MKRTLALVVALIGFWTGVQAATIPEDVNVGTEQNPGNVTIRGRNSSEPILNIRIPGTGPSKVAVTAEGKVGFGVNTPETVLHIRDTNPVVTLHGTASNAKSSIDMLEYANTGVRLFYDGAAGVGAGGRFEIRNKSDNVALLSLDRAGAATIGVGVSAPGSGGQVVVGKYNDTSSGHTAGVFVVGAGTATNQRQNAIRVLEDGTVLVKTSGDISPGEFTNGPTP